MSIKPEDLVPHGLDDMIENIKNLRGEKYAQNLRSATVMVTMQVQIHHIIKSGSQVGAMAASDVAGVFAMEALPGLAGIDAKDLETASKLHLEDIDRIRNIVSQEIGR